MFYMKSVKTALGLLACGSLLLVGCSAAVGEGAGPSSGDPSPVIAAPSNGAVAGIVRVPAVVGLSAFEGAGLLSAGGYVVESFLEDDVVVKDDQALGAEELKRLIVVEQVPAAGRVVEPGQIIELTFGNPLWGPETAGVDPPWEISCNNGEYGDGNVHDSFAELSEVWKSKSFKEFTTCSVEYVATAEWEPTKEESRIAKIANEHWDGDEVPVNAYATAMEHCAVPPAYEEDWGTIPLPWLEAAAELCPKAPFHKELAAWATGAKFTHGDYVVGKDIPAGTYRSSKKISDCYWERATPNGKIIANNFIIYTAAGAVVTVRKGESFNVEKECEVWTKQ
ncbi:PASTA domain-containing protein [Arthrobacter sp. UCD-GKA]|uniref:PASTA domain-containing protein n=1 Tax=Arthrobacter sp. UCD-GKA TaxID=1913576 RepID=UPI0011134B38|nr:PASTA domain-containing protein [Arthrobacter sp. UCD-GKA]